MTANQGARRDAYKNHQTHHDPAVRGLMERARAEGAAAALAGFAAWVATNRAYNGSDHKWGQSLYNDCINDVLPKWAREFAALPAEPTASAPCACESAEVRELIGPCPDAQPQPDAAAIKVAALREAADELPPYWALRCPTTRSEFIAWLQGRAAAIESGASDAGAGEGGGE